MHKKSISVIVICDHLLLRQCPTSTMSELAWQKTGQAGCFTTSTQAEEIKDIDLNM